MMQLGPWPIKGSHFPEGSGMDCSPGARKWFMMVGEGKITGSVLLGNVLTIHSSHETTTLRLCQSCKTWQGCPALRSQVSPFYDGRAVNTVQSWGSPRATEDGATIAKSMRKEKYKTLELNLLMVLPRTQTRRLVLEPPSLGFHTPAPRVALG